MVDDQIYRNKRVDRFWIAAEACNCGAHCSQIYNGGYTGKILHDNAGGQHGDAGACAISCPRCDVLYILLGDLIVVALAKSCLKHYADRKRKPLELSQPRFFQCVKTIVCVLFVPNL